MVEGFLGKSAITGEDGTESGDPGAARGGTIGSAIAVLRFVATAGQPLGVNAIARQLGLAPSSCFKILKALVAEDFVEIDEHTKTYSIGTGAVVLAHRALDPLRAFDAVRTRLEAAAAEHSIAFGLWRMTPNGRMLLIGFADGGDQMRIHMSVGQRLPLLVGAIGRAVAAQLDLPVSELRARFDGLRWQGDLSFEDYCGQVEDAKRLGYGLDDGRFARGVTTVAVPIIDNDGAVRYGLSAVMFSGKHDAAEVARIADAAVALGQWASARLCGRPLRVLD